MLAGPKNAFRLAGVLLAVLTSCAGEKKHAWCADLHLHIIGPLKILMLGHLAAPNLDERQITHLICARLKFDLYDFLGGVLGPFIQEKEQEAGPTHPKKSHIDHILGGHRLDE